MAKAGRRRALDDAKRREVCALVSAGYGIAGAAKYVGCATSTIRRESLRNPEFYDRLRNAQLAAELDPLRSVRKEAKSHWRAAAWLLERLDPERYGKRHPVYMKSAQVNEMIDQFSKVIVSAVKDIDSREEVLRALSDYSKNGIVDPKPLRDAHRAHRMLEPATTPETDNDGICQT